MLFSLKDESETVALGKKIAAAIKGGEIIYLSGELGAGKTTFVRGFLNALGHSGNVKSPTYTLVEPYSIDDKNIYHFDLYRINDPEELEAMGIRDYCDGESVCLYEWPEQGKEVLPDADIIISLSHKGSGREANIQPNSAKGEQVLSQISA
ncbi:MAG: tRNA (adenosine(37)-N6)-threonylcarbamoyltransferase complex ATPase subunit type 1 TsaE [Proteobacteria bacterium]|nr:tRNA (adenosine(37)-N6)-threonylcarbamoyltransferase complex ATPase subunit type 1 TsaE [Pseudomonadota bacterium]NOG58985.1 tRNA (adenosine(37)-N6)-threonylcarbamoyltransferase complex ATPase subunit type 1 TsaE [Pseudomonadota bacterium]